MTESLKDELEQTIKHCAKETRKAEVAFKPIMMSALAELIKASADIQRTLSPQGWK